MTTLISEPEQAALARFALEDLHEPLFVLDPSGALVAANDAARAAPFDVLELLAAAPRPAPAQQLIERARAHGRAAVDVTCNGRDGRAAQTLRLEAIAIDDYTIVLARVPAEDAALLRDELRELRSLAALGLKAAGLAHDLNNLLLPISALGSLLAEQLGSGEQRALLAEINAAADRAVRLARGVLNAVRPLPHPHERVDVNEIVNELRPLLGRLLGKDIELSIVPSPSPAEVELERARLEHTLLNLALNARDAMAGAGRFTIAVIHRAAGEARERAMVTISVTDTGAGISEAVRGRMFEPFFTTKSHGGGAGLGLASVRNFVLETGGRIAVYSEPGRGTVFKIDLPGARPART